MIPPNCYQALSWHEIREGRKRNDSNEKQSDLFWEEVEVAELSPFHSCSFLSVDRSARDVRSDIPELWTTNQFTAEYQSGRVVFLFPSNGAAALLAGDSS